MGNKSLSGYQKKRLFHNERGQAFTDQAPKYGVDSITRRPRRRGRGLRQRRPPRHVRRQRQRPSRFSIATRMPSAGHWVELALTGVEVEQACAVGAQVRRHRRAAARSCGSSTAATASPARASTRVHFGLGAATTIDKVEMRWPIRRAADSRSAGVPIDTHRRRPPRRIVEAGEAVDEMCSVVAASGDAPSRIAYRPRRSSAGAERGSRSRRSRPRSTAQPDDLQGRQRLPDGDHSRSSSTTARIAFFEKLTADHPTAGERAPELRLRLRRQDPGRRRDHAGDPRQQRARRIHQVARAASRRGSASTRAATAICSGRGSSTAPSSASPI